ncbi:PucR family transcriptional regulator [Streptomyces geranii]|uniref:PucR family transcriptional regulator n=1 Tax=Streptomyces geranii TaxID=2058923 RepID=UPI000D03FCF9|nr:helix-turn-helix domain-containing protein [Streptomyces geranii]
MGNLFTKLLDRLDSNARHATEVYRREVPEYRLLSRDPRSRREALEFSVWLRRRTVELASAEEPLGADDLALLASVGEQRAGQGLSLPGHRQLVVAHTRLTLHEVNESTGPDDGDDLMRVMRWFGPQATRAGEAHLSGFLAGQRRRMSLVGRVRQLTEALLADDPAAPALASAVGMRVHPRYRVTVVRVPDRPRPTTARREEITETLLRRRQLPITWHEPGELVALTPEYADEPTGAGTAPDRASAVVRDITEALSGSCAIGTSAGATGALAEAFARARRISRVAPLRSGQRHPHTMDDVFVELGVTRLPEVDDWLRDLAEHLSRGPDLITTLEMYYRHDMDRTRTAAALSVHSRTLDYRIQRAHELTGIHPGSTQGVRVLSVAVTRSLARG